MLTNLFTGLREHAIASGGLETANRLIPFESLQSLRSCERIDFTEALDKTWSAYFSKILEFPDPYREFATTKNCTAGKSYACKSTCISTKRNCLNPLPGQAQNYAAFLAMQSGVGGGTAPATTTKTKKPKKSAASAAVPVAPPSNTNPIKTNSKELNDKRSYLVKQFGQKTVDAAEQNVQKILNDPDTNVYIRVGSTDTLDKILGSEFKTSAELGIQSHNIPFLNDKYQDARNRVEAKVLGYDEKNTAAGDRPIYGYIAGKNLDGKSHEGTDVYGEIKVKLKPQVKDRATFTGADSFKSGIASEVVNQGPPPPPNAASLVASTRHGYDKDKLPSSYPSSYKDKSGDGRQLLGAAKAQSIDDLPGLLAPTGNAYVEAQIHGKVRPQDIEELHFKKTGDKDGLTQQALDNAHKYGIKVYLNGKEIKPGTNLSADNDTQKLNNALDAGDFSTALDLSEQVTKQANALKQTPANSHDRRMAYLAAQNGFADKPKEVSDKDVTSAWQQGGHLLIRGVGKGFLKPFIDDEYYVGGNGGTMYGNGQYAWHCGKAKRGQTVPPPPVGYDPKDASKDAKNAFDTGDRLGYIGAGGQTIRMALPKDAKITTQTSMVKEMKDLDKKIDTWAAQERAKIAASTQSATQSTPTTSAQSAAIQSEAKIVEKSLASAYKKTLKLLGTPTPMGDMVKVQFEPPASKAGKVAPETMPDSFGVKWARLGTFEAVSPLGAVKAQTTTAAVKQLREDYIKVKAASKVARDELTKTHDLNPQSLSANFSTGTYVIVPKSGGQPIDTGMRIEPSGRDWVVKENGKDVGSYRDLDNAKSFLVEKHIENEAVGLIKGAGLGGFATSNKQTQALNNFDQKVRSMKDLLFGDSHGLTTPSGRYAVIKGYDGCMADQSYEPERMFVVYNRGKVLVQRNALDYNQGRKTGAA